MHLQSFLQSPGNADDALAQFYLAHGERIQQCIHGKFGFMLPASLFLRPFVVAPSVPLPLPVDAQEIKG